MKTNFYLKLNGFSIDEIDNMIPWEREVYTLLVDDYMKEKEKASKMETP